MKAFPLIPKLWKRNSCYREHPGAAWRSSGVVARSEATWRSQTHTMRSLAMLGTIQQGGWLRFARKGGLLLALLGLMLLAGPAIIFVQAADVFVLDPFVQAPIVHSGRYHILSSGQTSVVLDGSKGMRIAAIGQRKDEAGRGRSFSIRIERASFEVELNDSGKAILLDQSNDPAAKLQVISQGSTHVAARVFFSMCSADGRPFGTGTLDFYIYPNRIHLVPSIYIDDLNPSTRITRAGFIVFLAEGKTRLEISGKEIAASGKTHFADFGDDGEGFEITTEKASGETLKIGWLRNLYPNFPYLREVDRNPQIDELYDLIRVWFLGALSESAFSLRFSPPTIVGKYR